jgi:hypothetical protein
MLMDNGTKDNEMCYVLKLCIQHYAILDKKGEEAFELKPMVVRVRGS